MGVRGRAPLQRIRVPEMVMMMINDAKVSPKSNELPRRLTSHYHHLHIHPRHPDMIVAVMPALGKKNRAQRSTDHS